MLLSECERELTKAMAKASAAAENEAMAESKLREADKLLRMLRAQQNAMKLRERRASAAAEFEAEIVDKLREAENQLKAMDFYKSAQSTNHCR
jgi:hypothetical protein